MNILTEALIKILNFNNYTLLYYHSKKNKLTRFDSSILLKTKHLVWLVRKREGEIETDQDSQTSKD